MGKYVDSLDFEAQSCNWNRNMSIVTPSMDQFLKCRRALIFKSLVARENKALHVVFVAVNPIFRASIGGVLASFKSAWHCLHYALS